MHSYLRLGRRFPTFEHHTMGGSAAFTPLKQLRSVQLTRAWWTSPDRPQMLMSSV